MEAGTGGFFKEGEFLSRPFGNTNAAAGSEVVLQWEELPRLDEMQGLFQVFREGTVMGGHRVLTEGAGRAPAASGQAVLWREGQNPQRESSTDAFEGAFRGACG